MSQPDYSIGEIGSLVLKAYRGTGMPWGLAEEAGFAASWLAMHRLPGIEAFAGLMKIFDGVLPPQRAPTGSDSPLHSAGGLLCPVSVGAAIGDFYGGRRCWSEILLGATSYPVILIPFVDRLAAGCGRRITAQWAMVSVASNGDGVVVEGDPSGLGLDRSEQIVLSLDDGSAPPRKGISRRGTGHPAAIKTLEFYAHRTYVPASDGSRLAGAGAGLNDND